MLYNAQVNAANAELKRHIHGNKKIASWSCKGVKFSYQVVMHVHLNNGVGIFKYYKAIRGAVVHGLNFEHEVKDDNLISIITDHIDYHYHYVATPSYVLC